VFRGIDIREVGDGNVGAANAYREIGPAVGVVVLGVDVLKGAIAIMVTQALTPQPVAFPAGLAAVTGHIRPLYIGFKGGRGESTTIGVLFTLLPQAMLILLAIYAVPFLATRNTMLAGTILLSPLWLLALLMGASGALVCYSIGLPCVVGLTHFLSTRHLPDEVKQGIAYMR
jgi:glycerol-3-phosphate acyltransferase PlsY